MGILVLLWITLTKIEAMAPMESWMLPSKADALPADFEKGFNASADVFGNTKPWHARKQKMRKTMPLKESRLNNAITSIINPIAAWIIRARFATTSLLNLFNMKLF